MEEEIKIDNIDDKPVDIFSEGYGIIPNTILHSEKISSFAKLLYCDISSLCAQRGYCWATNKYFSERFNTSVRTIVRAIAELEEYLIIRDGGNAKRVIWVNSTKEQSTPKRKKAKKEIVEEVEPVVPKKEKLIKKYSDDDLFLAELLLQKIIYNFPTFENKKVKITDWADDMRKIREIDKATNEQITFMIIWLQGGDYTPAGKLAKKFEPHNFWSKNILSASKLRKQWFTLVPQLQQELKTTQKKSTIVQL